MEDAKRLETSYTAERWDIKWYSRFEKDFGSFLKAKT